MRGMSGRRALDWQIVELDGVRYAVIRESTLQGLCRRARVALRPARVASGDAPQALGAELDSDRLAARLREWRTRCRLTQSALARLAGVRVETLNRIERRKTTPDVATLRKLIGALRKRE
jgi:DNA-binding XRE family transcriptional regulator